MVLRPAIALLAVCGCVTTAAAPVRDDDAERIGAAMRDAPAPAQAVAAVDPKSNDDDRIDAIVAHDGADVPAEGLLTPIRCRRCGQFGTVSPPGSLWPPSKAPMTGASHTRSPWQ